jgi:hypothetical protein
MKIKLSNIRKNIKYLLIEEAMASKPLALVQQLDDFNKKIEEKIKSIFGNIKHDINVGICIEGGDAHHFAFFCLMIKDGTDKIIKFSPLESTYYPDHELRNIDKKDIKVNKTRISNFSKSFCDFVFAKSEENKTTIQQKANELYMFLNDLNLPFGSITFGGLGSDEKQCLDSYVIYQTFDTKKGWGPLLYDLAIEVASMEANGLTSDRSTVSDEAYKVWDNYFKNRPDVSKMQLDIDKEQDYLHKKVNQLTPEDETDDCSMESTFDYHGDTTWTKSPLSKTYKKNPQIINKLKSLKILHNI